MIIGDCVLSDANDSDDVKALKAMVFSTCSKRSIRLATSQDATKKKRKTWCPSGEDCLQSFLVFAQVYKRLFSVSELNYFVKFPFISIAIRSMLKCIESTDSYLSGEGYLDIFREISSNQSSLVVKALMVERVNFNENAISVYLYCMYRTWMKQSSY